MRMSWVNGECRVTLYASEKTLLDKAYMLVDAISRHVGEAQGPAERAAKALEEFAATVKRIEGDPKKKAGPLPGQMNLPLTDGEGPSKDQPVKEAQPVAAETEDAPF